MVSVLVRTSKKIQQVLKPYGRIIFPAGPSDHVIVIALQQGPLLCEKNFHATPNVVMRMRRGVAFLFFFFMSKTLEANTPKARALIG